VVGFRSGVRDELLQRPEGIGSLRARLETSTGKWQGSARSNTLKLALEVPEPPEPTVLGLDEGPLFRGSPLLFDVALCAPLNGPGVVLPDDVAGFATTLEIALLDCDAQIVPLEMQMLALPVPVRRVLAPGGVHGIRCRIPAAVTETRAPGTYRSSLRYRAPAPRSVSSDGRARTRRGSHGRRGERQPFALPRSSDGSSATSSGAARHRRRDIDGRRARAR
jgi:hypothetical protein